MRDITLLSYDYPPNDGGISRLASAVTTELVRRGREVEVLTMVPNRKAGLKRPEVVTQEVPSTLLGRDLRTYGYLRRLAPETRILTTVWNPEATLALLARRTDVTVMAHGNEVMPYSKGSALRFKKYLRHRVLGAAHAVVCNSHYTERLVLGLNADARTVVISPAVDASRFAGLHNEPLIRSHFGLPTTKRLILSVSRLDAHKGHDIVLHALARLSSESRSQLHYAVAGRGGHLNVLQHLAKDLGVSDCVSWLSFVADDALPGLYACADLFALCTREDFQTLGVEGFGIVFLEAQAAGCAVLGTRAGGIPDAVVEGEGGWLVAQDDIAGVSAYLDLLAKDVIPFRQEGMLGRRRVCRVATWERYVDQLLAVIDREHV